MPLRDKSGRGIAKSDAWCAGSGAVAASPACRNSARGAFDATFTSRLGDLLDLAIADAGRADLHPATRAFHQSANRLQVDVPAPLRHIVGVADPVAELRPPPAYFANSCHKTEISLAFRKTQYTNAAGRPATSRDSPDSPTHGCFATTCSTLRQMNSTSL